MVINGHPCLYMTTFFRMININITHNYKSNKEKMQQSGADCEDDPKTVLIKCKQEIAKQAVHWNFIFVHANSSNSSSDSSIQFDSFYIINYR